MRGAFCTLEIFTRGRNQMGLPESPRDRKADQTRLMPVQMWRNVREQESAEAGVTIEVAL